MEKNSKEREASKHRSYFVMKVLLFVLCVVVVIQFAVVAKAFASLKALNDRLNDLEKEKALGFKSSGSEKHHEPDTRRSKRSIDETEFNRALIKLQKLEERFNKSYEYVGRHPAFLLRGVPGTPGKAGRDGTPGTPGRDGIPGTSAKNGIQGPPGQPGNQGTRGNPGRDGRDGAQGSRGTPGVRGQRGPAGPSANVGVSYIRWGKKTCPNTGASLVYEGYVGGSHFKHKGGASNYACLTRDPIYANYRSGVQIRRARIYGAEYQTAYGIYPSSLHNHDVPCAVCHVTKRASKMMIPGRNKCPAGWTREYKGYLMAERYDHHRTMFTCVDEYPDYTRGTHANLDGALFYFVDGVCGSLPCKPYIEGRELTCAVCTR